LTEHLLLDEVDAFNTVNIYESDRGAFGRLTFVEVVLVLLARSATSGCRVKLIAQAAQEAAACLLLLLLAAHLRGVVFVGAVASGHVLDEVHGEEMGLAVRLRLNCLWRED